MTDVWLEPRLALLVMALTERTKVEVETSTRHFTGFVEGVYASPYSPKLRATVSLDDGKVENFYVDKDDCQIRPLDG